MKISERRIDLQKREQGAWVGDIPEWQGVRFKVRGVGNKDWARLEARLINAVPRQQRINGLEPKERDRINALLLSETSLMDWEGLEDDNGTPLPFSKELAVQYLTNPEYEPFRQAVMLAANIVADRDRGEVEAIAGN